MFHVKLLQKFGEAGYPAVVNALQPPYDYKNMPIIVPEGIVWKSVPAQLALFDGLDAAFGKRDRGLGSNNWVVSGSRTTTGQAAAGKRSASGHSNAGVVVLRLRCTASR